MREREPVERRAATSAQMSALSIQPYALLSSGAFGLHHFADRAICPCSQKTAISRDDAACSRLPIRPSPPPSWSLVPPRPPPWSHQK